jgi:hypothetical protein
MEIHHAIGARVSGLAVALGLAGLALAPAAHSEPGFAPAPTYHWCPGDAWDPAWGFNWEWARWHDDHHRDIDGNYHGFDYWGPPPPGATPNPWEPPNPGTPPFWWRR